MLWPVRIFTGNFRGRSHGRPPPHTRYMDWFLTVPLQIYSVQLLLSAATPDEGEPEDALEGKTRREQERTRKDYSRRAQNAVWSLMFRNRLHGSAVILVVFGYLGESGSWWRFDE